MTGTVLYNRLIEFGDIDVPETTVVGWIDMAQREVAAECPVVATQTLSDVVAGTTTLSISNGIIDILSAVYEEGDYPLSDITIDGDELSFGLDADSLTIKYTTLPALYSTLSSELTIHKIFHPYVLYFLISMYYDSEAEGDPEESSVAREFYQRWMFFKNQAISTLSNTQMGSQNEPTKTTDVLPKTRRSTIVEDDYYE